MSKVTTTYYMCDCCKNKYKDDNILIKTELPARQWDCEGKSSSIGKSKVDLCPNCFKKFKDVVFNNFAEVDDLYGIKMDMKFKPDWLRDDIIK